MTDIVVEGVGMTPFGRFDDQTPVSLGVAAIQEALKDADTGWSEVEALYCGHMYAKTGAGHRIAAVLGATGLPIINLENACSSGGAAIQLARQALVAGEYETVVAVGIEKMPRGMMDMDYFALWRQRIGHAVNPVQFALAAQRHMSDYGTTEEQLAIVAEKNHRHSVHNDRAMYRREFSVEEILASRLVTDPLRLLMLCTPNEGGAAAVLRRRRAESSDVSLVGHGLATAAVDQVFGEHMPTYSPIVEPRDSATRRAANAAYARAGLGPSDLDLAEVQDTDSATEIITTEELGLCARGEGGPFAASGATSIGGQIPVNPSGGLLSKGEPVGASGLGQVYEVVGQLKGRCGARQVRDARVGLTHSLGAGGNCSVLVFKSG